MRKIVDKTRIVVTCPATGVVVITKLTYEEMIRPRARPMLFACACGETHKLLFAGRYPGRREPKPVDRHRAG
jgi:hypothetical protein